MNTTAKPKSANVTQQFRDVTDTSAERSKEVFETIGAATTEAAEVMTTCCSTALKGMQDYNSKVLEFAQRQHRVLCRICPKAGRREVALGIRRSFN